MTFLLRSVFCRNWRKTRSGLSVSTVRGPRLRPVLSGADLAQEQGYPPFNSCFNDKRLRRISSTLRSQRIRQHCMNVLLCNSAPCVANPANLQGNCAFSAVWCQPFSSVSAGFFAYVKQEHPCMVTDLLICCLLPDPGAGGPAGPLLHPTQLAEIRAALQRNGGIRRKTSRC